MIAIRKVEKKEKKIINEIVNSHLETFTGFFLTFLGKGFLKLLYKSYVKYKDSGLLVALEDDKVAGFIAYSGDYSGLYKYMLKTRLIPFMWFSFIAFCKKPKIFFRLFRALKKKDEVKRTEKYVELASIGVKPDFKSNGIGSKLIDYLKKIIDFNVFEYINLETDADNNDYVNNFYKKNSFILSRTYSTDEGRRMNEYRFYSRGAE